MTLGQTLRKARFNNGDKGLRETAPLLGISAAALSLMENDKLRPSAQTLDKAARLFSIPLLDLAALREMESDPIEDAQAALIAELRTSVADQHAMICELEQDGGMFDAGAKARFERDGATIASQAAEIAELRATVANWDAYAGDVDAQAATIAALQQANLIQSEGLYAAQEEIAGLRAKLDTAGDSALVIAMRDESIEYLTAQIAATEAKLAEVRTKCLSYEQRPAIIPFARAGYSEIFAILDAPTDGEGGGK